MSYTSGFFDAVDLGGGNYDRTYSAAVFAHYFSLLVKNGVFPDPSTGMQVKASTNPDMHVSVQPGNGWVNGYYITVSENNPEVLTVPTANPSLSRIDSVIMGLNYVEREIQLYIKSGAVSASPSAVSLQRDNDLYELELAQIAVAAGVASISQANITDMRQNTSRCGIVKGTVDQIDTTELFAQYDAAFQTWFESIQGQLSGDVAGNLQNQINNKAEKTHASTHATQGSDPLTPTSIGALSDSAGAVKTSNLAAEAVTRAKLGKESVGTDQLGAAVVITQKIADEAVTPLKLANDARFGTELAINTPGSTPDLAWGNALVWVWGTSMTIKLTAEVSALLPPNWQTRLFANDPFTFEWEGIGTPVNVAKGQTESATGSIAVPAKKYIDLKKIDNNIWIFSGTYAERMIYTGTSETPPAEWKPGDIYLKYAE